MSYDAIIVGAGLGGLLAGAKLAKSGRRVLILEKKPHIGGTSYIFRRGDYFFPMGPLSFSNPGRVEALLEEAGVDHGLEFRRNHFQLLTPHLDIVYSQPLAGLRDELRRLYPAEAGGIDRVFSELLDLVALVRDIDRWHPDYSLRAAGSSAGSAAPDDVSSRIELVRARSAASSLDLLGPLIRDPHLMNLLGSMGTDPPQMSLLNLAFMWAAMSEIGIWFPSNGIHGICRMLASAVGFGGGEIRLRCPAVRILVEDGRAAGVRTADGGEFRAPVVISNADYKKTFLELLDPASVPSSHLAAVRDVPYTGSELCVYLGVDPRRVDLSRMKAEHLFYRERVDSSSEHDPLDFAGREIEICRWSDNAPDCAPPDKAVLVLRVGLPYPMFEDWRRGEKLRKPGYREAKNRMAWALIKTVEGALPGLRGSVEVMETATPLTYRDWGQRTDGSIAGWTWSAEAAARLPGKLLVETPVDRLYMVGVYAATELFLGGVPTALQTGSLAADRVLGR